MKKSRHINFIALDKLATWKHPVWGNILLREEYPENRALAIICDDCLKGNKEPKYAVEWDENYEKITYHPINELKDLPPINQEKFQDGQFFIENNKESRLLEILKQLDEAKNNLRNLERKLESRRGDIDFMVSEYIPARRRCIDKLLDLLLLDFGKEKATCETVKKYIYNFKGEKVGRFVQWFFDLLDMDKVFEVYGADSKQEELQIMNKIVGVIMEAWNVYPHKELGGKCPLELVVTGEKRPGFDEDAAGRPEFENILYMLVERGYLDESFPSRLRMRIYEESGKPDSFHAFRKWFIRSFGIKLNKKQREIVDYITRKAWKFYPHKVLGDKSPMQIKIEQTSHCEEKGCKENDVLYICEECGKVFCFVHAGVHATMHKHNCRRIDDYMQRLKQVLSSVKRQSQHKREGCK